MIIQANAKRVPLKSHTAALVYIDPPYYNDWNKPNTPAQTEPYEWITEAIRIMNYNAWFVICVGRNSTKNLTRFKYEQLLFNFFPQLILCDELVWHFDFGTYTRKHFVPSHELILVFKYGEPHFYWFNITRQSWRQKHGDIRGDSRGRIPGTVLNIPRVPGNSKQRLYIQGKHRNCQPTELCELIVKAFTKPGDLVVDLFGGSGSMYKVARYLGRRCLYVDINKVYCKEALARMDDWKRVLVEEL